MNRQVKQMATIRDVAKKAGVSVTLVSRVLNNQKGVGPESRKRILQAMEELNYRVNSSARALVSRKTHAIGVIADNMCTSFIFDLWKGLQHGVTSTGSDYTLLYCDGQNDPAIKAQQIQFLTEGRVDGIIIYGSMMSDEQVIRSLIRSKFPLLLIEHDLSDADVDKVLVANYEGAYEATEHLINLGHRNILHFTGDMNIQASLERLNGYAAAMRDHNLPMRDDMIIRADFDEESGYQRMLEVLDRGVPEAIFFAADNTAFGALRAMDERGVLMPQDISFVGFDDDRPQENNIYQQYYRPLTTFRQPLFEMGDVGIRLLLDRINNPKRESVTHTFDTEKLVRDSAIPATPE